MNAGNWLVRRSRFCLAHSRTSSAISEDAPKSESALCVVACRVESREQKRERERERERDAVGLSNAVKWCGDVVEMASREASFSLDERGRARTWNFLKRIPLDSLGLSTTRGLCGTVVRGLRSEQHECVGTHLGVSPLCRLLTHSQNTNGILGEREKTQRDRSARVRKYDEKIEFLCGSV